MSEPDEIRQRLDALEAQVNVLTEGQAESRRPADLFAMVDRDVADLKQAFGAQRHVLQALRDTQVEQGRALVEHGQALGAIVVTLGSIQETQRSMQGEMHSMRDAQRSTQDDVRSLQGDMRSVQQTLADHGRILARLDPGD
ncbi:MAG TPA: hypothetical protein VMC83_16895 [Streptosporangiaceae bacterium]|nr:hypothetical protein [Streptosporangiaceae bacterium]